MSNLIKSKNVNYQSPQRFITLQIPVIDTGHSKEQKRKKVLEELDELLSEMSSGDVYKPDALAEFYDVIQVMCGYLLCNAKELTIIDPHGMVDMLLKTAGKVHQGKIDNYARERNWTVVKG